MAISTFPADQPWLEAPQTGRLIAVFDRAGLDFRFVGGAVRDGLLGRPVADIDIATPSFPEAVIRALEAAGHKAIPTGLAHGTVTALVRGRHFEITTLRRDVETDGRHAVVAFTEDWREDAARRDFTMNALYADRDGRIMDFFGGIDDARAGRVRFIGDPDRRITEDALRILRFFRFHAWYGQGQPDADGLAACARLAGMIDGLSGERIQAEILKLLGAPDPAPVWQAMIAAGVVAHAVPKATRVADLIRLVGAERHLGLAAGPLRRLAALTGPMEGEQVAILKARLKLSNHDEAALLAIDGMGETLALIGQGSFGRALYRRDPELVRDAALLGYARSRLPDLHRLGALLAFIGSWREPRFPVSGSDLVTRGIQPGAGMGRLLKQVEDWWVAGGFMASREECLAELARLT